MGVRTEKRKEKIRGTKNLKERVLCGGLLLPGKTHQLSCGPLHNRCRILLPSPSTALVSNSCLSSLDWFRNLLNSSPCFRPGPSTTSPLLCPPQNFHSNPLQLEARSHCCSIQDSLMASHE